MHAGTAAHAFIARELAHHRLPRTLRGVVPENRLAEILSFTYEHRMRYLRILRYLLPRTDNLLKPCVSLSH